MFSPMLLTTDDIQGIRTNWDKLRKLMHAVPFILKDTPEPTIFKYGERRSGDGLHLSYVFEFYGGFHVYVRGVSATDLDGNDI